MRRLCNSALKETGQASPPFKISPLLRLAGVEWSYEDQTQDDRDAAIVFAEGGLKLAIAREKFQSGGVSKRWRFSVAHEFAHVVLIRAVGARVVDLANSSKEAYEYVERLCDYGASQILVPRTSLRQTLRQRKLSQRTVDELSDLYDVSLSVLMWSLTDLLPEGGMMFLREYRRSAQESNELRVWSVYSRYSPTLEEPWLPRGCTMKHIRVGQRPLGFEHLDARGPLPIELVLGKRVRKLEASVVPWQSRWWTSSFFDDERSDYIKASENGLLLACAATGKLDLDMFGGKK
ncbi:ImmA/IrrE family metallo-endopeptidase [uncultured Roseobacter sp.]|uniref:ImmA/IrrE family metallo-endopeptidase n=1 Tax=uncultured Roseobacter sp. TaxID=114847 RepID=UPI003450B75F